MTKYDVTVEYLTGSGVKKVQTYEIEARSATIAKDRLRRNFSSDLRRQSSNIIKLTAVPAKVQPNGDVVITVTDNRPPLPVVEASCKDLTADDEFRVGQSVTVIYGDPRLQGIYYIQSVFNDKGGSRRITLERAGFNSTSAPRFVTVTPARLRELTRSRDTVEYKVLYPDDRVFTQGQPNTYSSYGLDQLVQIKLTKRNGKIIKKELV